jgi:hypothetical protein
MPARSPGDATQGMTSILDFRFLNLNTAAI